MSIGVQIEICFFLYELKDSHLDFLQIADFFLPEVQVFQDFSIFPGVQKYLNVFFGCYNSKGTVLYLTY